LFAEAFSNDARLADDRRTQDRYNAACAAALAGCGQGTDAGKRDEQEGARLRKQAVAWLRADLDYWTRQAESTNPTTRSAAQQVLQHWQSDADVAGIRDRDTVAKLPADEREPCRQLWADVAELLRKVEPKKVTAAVSVQAEQRPRRRPYPLGPAQGRLGLAFGCILTGIARFHGKSRQEAQPTFQRS
jgi:hypothetical protein